MTEETTTGGPKGRARLVRWRAEARRQLGYTVNLFFTLTVAALGYLFFVIRDPTFSPGPTARGAMLLALCALTFAIACGFLCILNRLYDIRGTALRVGGHKGAPTTDELHRVGKITWALFWTHCVSFVVGVGALGAALLLTYISKLV